MCRRAGVGYSSLDFELCEHFERLCGAVVHVEYIRPLESRLSPLRPSFGAFAFFDCPTPYGLIADGDGILAYIFQGGRGHAEPEYVLSVYTISFYTV